MYTYAHTHAPVPNASPPLPLPCLASPTHPGTYIQWNVGEEEWHWILENEIGPIPEFFTPDEEWLQGCLPVSVHNTPTPPQPGCERVNACLTMTLMWR